MASPQDKKPSEPFDPIEDSAEKGSKRKYQDGLITYAKNNSRDTIAYVLLIAGVIMLFFAIFWGSLIIGLILGFYFDKEIMDIVKNSNEYADRVGTVRLLILAGTAVGVFIAAPGFFIGAAIALAVKQLSTGEVPKL